MDTTPYPAPVQLQRRLASIAAHPDKPRHTSVIVFSLEGELDVERFTSAVNSVVARHGILSAAFEWSDGDGARIVPHAGTTPLLEVVRSGGDALADALREATTAGFDLWAGPLGRFTLIQHSPNEFVFALVVDHYIFDGWSSDIFLREVGEAYSSPGGFSQAPGHYRDFCAWQAELLGSERASTLLDFWKDLGEGIPRGIAVPGFGPPEGGDQVQGRSITMTLDDNLASTLRAAARNSRAGDFAFWFASLARGVAFVAGREEVPVHFNTSNRSQALTRNALGYVTHGLMSPARQAADSDGHGFLERVIRQHRRVLVHEALPYATLVSTFYPEDFDESVHPPHVYLAVTGVPELKLDGVSARHVEQEPPFVGPGVNLFVEIDSAVSLTLLAQDHVLDSACTGLLDAVLSSAQELGRPHV